MDIKDLVEVDATAMHVMRVALKAPGHGGDAHSAIRYVRNAYMAEPLFVIRGRDALAFQSICGYAELCTVTGLDAMADQVYAHARRFREWQAGWTELTKLPDPHPSWPGLGKISVDDDGACHTERIPFSAPQAMAGVSEDASPFWTSHEVAELDPANLAAAVRWAQDHGWIPVDNG